ncbi:MAG: hypothetical protein FWF84_06095, partial [Kiritimatiellaeota bacterium]|nr:hypothetical protein [Kiritimatiellota bacterium]
YGKYCISGVPGWNAIYDYPEALRGLYSCSIGTWCGVWSPLFDRFRDQDFRVYSPSVAIPGNMLNTWWQEFIQIWPDANPHWVRVAAEEVVRSIEMFGWDAVRWDGHPRGGGQCGGSGDYDYLAARRTQTLMRYFKDITEATSPGFRHGYNYLMIEPEKTHDWAVEDFELDELCRGGGLMMNESIGNASSGWTFAQILRNLQVEGDLCRERGGFYLGISYAGYGGPRDPFLDSAMWAAAGCRPYGVYRPEIHRYLTRFAAYTLDETLRRLAKPEAVIKPVGETPVLWDAFVFETERKEGKSQLVVNLLNLPLEAVRRHDEKDQSPREYAMPPGVPSATFALTLPQGMKATAVHWIDPPTLEVIPLALEGNTFTTLPVNFFHAIVIDMECDDAAPTLASLYGVPVTFGAKREAVADAQRFPALTLGTDTPKAEAMEAYATMGGTAQGGDFVSRVNAMAALPMAQRPAAMAKERTPMEEILKDSWHKGVNLAADLALTNATLAFGDLTPERNGVMDVYYARGAMDYRLRMPGAFGALDRVRYHDAPLTGSAWAHYDWGLFQLANALPWRDFPDYDVLLYTGIPHQAIGAENAYALREYVKAGGGVLFTGGEYAFGRGGYLYTVLDRDILPVSCYTTHDAYCPPVPAVLEPGPDFAELGVTLDFSAQPRIWICNVTAPRPGAKVFLKANDIPILVGWELGAGRVLCLLTDYRGKATNVAQVSRPVLNDGLRTGQETCATLMPFFDWDDWPKLGAAMMNWCAPEAYTLRHCEERSDEATQRLITALKSASDDDLLADFDRGMSSDMMLLPDADASAARRRLSKDDLAKRQDILAKALRLHTPDVADVLAEQLAAVENFPCEMRMRLVTALQRTPSRQMAKEGALALKSGSSALYGSAYYLLALAGDDAFAAQALRPAVPGAESKEDTRDRLRDLAVAISVYPKPGLEARAKERIAALDATEAKYYDQLKKLMKDDAALYETSPCLNADDLLERMGWLGYLARQNPKEYGAPFLREWQQSHLYGDYAHRTYANVIDRLFVNWDSLETFRLNWYDFAHRMSAYSALNRDTALAVATAAPATAGAAFARARTMSEARAAMNILGSLPPSAIPAIFPSAGGEDGGEAISGQWSVVSGGIRHPDLRAFVTARK